MQDLKIAAIQMTSIVGDIEGNLATIDRLLGDAVSQGADIACFPELSVSGYNTNDRAGQACVGEAENSGRVPPVVEIPGEVTEALVSIGVRNGIWY